MAQANVSSCVLSILASFTSAIDIFRAGRSRKRHRRTNKKKADADDDGEARLIGSLTRGPASIGQEYQRSLQVFGERFAAGDPIAYTSLAEVLLRLNTGLVIMINQFLHQQGDLVEYASLTDLSERTRKDTCSTLTQLHQRLLRSPYPMRLHGDSYQSLPSESDFRKKSTESALRRKQAKTRRPMLANVVIADSSKPSRLAMVKPGEHKKTTRKQSPAAPGSSKTQSKTSLALPPQPHVKTSKGVSPTPQRQQYTALHATPVPRGNHSTMDVDKPRLEPAPDMLRATRSTPWLPASIPEGRNALATSQRESLPPYSAARSRKPIPTYYSIESNSTKLGEIPLHKWAEPHDFDAMSLLNKEAIQNGWPIREEQFEQQEKKRGMGFFRLFRRKGKE